MNRKNTILLAVFINAGLLVVLFVTALTSSEDLSMPPTHELSTFPTKQDLHKQELSAPLFGDEFDVAMRQPSISSHSENLVLPQVLPEGKPVQSSPVHALPPPASIASAPIQVPSPSSSNPISSSEVVVKKGDTLEKIAKAKKTTVDEIIKANHLPSSFLRVGQVLKMPTSRPSIQVAKGKPIERNDQGPDYYTVKVGDNPWTIAMKNHIKVDELLKMNALNDEKARKLKAGDRLRIR